MKKDIKTYFRSFYLTAVIILCLVIWGVGTAKAYENTVKIGFGKTKSALQIEDGKLRILDFYIDIKF